MSHSVYSDEPWFHPTSLVYLSSLLKPDWVIFETGCGSSTLYFSNRAKRVVSFEQTKGWYNILKEIIKDKEIENIDLRFDPDYPEKGIWGFREDEFDFVSLDGRGRAKSIETLLPYLKPGGYLLLDNSERARYEKAIALLNKWKNRVFGDYKWQTTIWEKP